MKSKKSFLLYFGAAFAIVFASCSTSVDIAKRQFNNGYYVHVTKKNSAKDKNELKVAKQQNNSVVIAKNIEPTTALNEQIPSPSAKQSSEVNAEVASVKKSPIASAKRNVSFTPVKKVKNSASENNYSKPQKHFFTPMPKVRKEFTGNAGVPTIVLVLLCLFLPFIAVGLVDNWKNRFWLDILLCILFWLPGVIYAFIVCFA